MMNDPRPKLVDVVRFGAYRLRCGGECCILRREVDDLGSGDTVMGVMANVSAHGYKDGPWLWTGGNGYHYPYDPESPFNEDGHPLDMLEQLNAEYLEKEKAKQDAKQAAKPMGRLRRFFLGR